jgi:group I intron endonuclease
MKKIGIYMIKNEINEKFYIGSSKNIDTRWVVHKSKLKMNKHDNIHLQRSYNKYGKENFSYIILEETDAEILLSKEQEYLDKYKDDTQSFNIGLKSSGGDNLTNNPNREEIIEKIKNSLKIRYENMTDEEKQKISENHKGVKNANYGNNWSEEMKQIASKRTTEYFKTHDQSLKNKTLEEFYGYDTAKEMKEKMSDHGKTRTGEKNPFYGKKHTEETKEKIKEKRIGKYFGEQNIPFMIDNIEYPSLGTASKELGINIATIRWRLNSNNKKFDNYQYKK